MPYEPNEEGRLDPLSLGTLIAIVSWYRDGGIFYIPASAALTIKLA